MRLVCGEKIEGLVIDTRTRCKHYDSDLDIIAIKFKCCGKWFPCFECHSAVAGHTAEVWPKEEFGERAILCGPCGYQLKIKELFCAGSICPRCKSKFNPGCANHYHLYFEQDKKLPYCACQNLKHKLEDLDVPPSLGDRFAPCEKPMFTNKNSVDITDFVQDVFDHV